MPALPSLRLFPARFFRAVAFPDIGVQVVHDSTRPLTVRAYTAD